VITKAGGPRQLAAIPAQKTTSRPHLGLRLDAQCDGGPDPSHAQCVADKRGCER